LYIVNTRWNLTSEHFKSLGIGPLKRLHSRWNVTTTPYTNSIKFSEIHATHQDTV